MPGRNESGERLLEMCAEQELVVGNSWFKKNYVFEYTWLSGERKDGRQGIDGLCVVTKTKLWRLLDVKVWRGEGLTIIKWKLG